MNIKTHLISSLLAKLGFESVKNSSINNRLSHLQPDGQTALRDSIKSGLNLILKLNSSLDELGYSNLWNFVHIVITDGVDTVSSTSLNELAMIFALINRGISTDRCLTVFIGIDLNAQAFAELIVLKALGGENCQIYNVNNVNLAEIFHRITASITMLRQVRLGVASFQGVTAMRYSESNTPVIGINKKNFAILLNLDISGSMAGDRYNSLKNSVNMFLNNLENNDLASCIVFNDRPMMLNSIAIKTSQTEDSDNEGVQIRCANQ